MVSFSRILFLPLFIFVISCSPQAQNIALNKSYVLSVPPNELKTAPSTDKNSLTDGVFTKFQFFKNNTTLGWKKKSATITIDLSKIESVGSVLFNTARKTQVGIDYPQNIFVFLSNDDKKYHFAGDAADSPENQPGDYKVETFSLDNINEEARFVKIVVVPNGKRIYCDEIQVMRGTQSSNLKSGTQDIAITDVNSYVDSLVSAASNNLRMENVVNNLAIKDQSLKRKLEENPNEVEKILLTTISENLQKKFNTPFVVSKVNAWDSISEFHEPKEDLLSLNYGLSCATGTNKFGAFTVTNTSKTVEIFSFEIISDSRTDLKLFHALFVSSGKNSQVPDPLVPIETLEIKPGSTQLFLFQLSPLDPGTSTAKIEVETSTKKVTLNLKINTINLSGKISSNLPNTNIWPYLNTPMLEGIEVEAGKDLEKHHIKTIVLNPRILPSIESKDFSKVTAYLKNFSKADYILLFTRFSSKGKGDSGTDFMSPRWKENFTEWYRDITKLIHQNGFPEAKILLYPYDEVRGADIKDFERFAIWGKKEVPNLKIFATISNEEAAETILPLVDIAQIQLKKDILKSLPAHSAEIWTYRNGSPARALPPYQFYRLKSWRAFFDDVKGVGFWSYSDENKELGKNLVSKNIMVPSSSYSVIYNGQNGNIISSRRWEAFSLGLEDYAILKIYASKFGMEKAKSLAKDVIDSPNDLGKADAALEKMFKELQ